MKHGALGDFHHSRSVWLRADVHRNRSLNGATRNGGVREQAKLVDHHWLFNRYQLRLSQVVRGHTQPGIAVFALHLLKGIAGYFWLAATERLRAGTIGRHSHVDLLLGDDEALSLRHLLVLVRRTPDAPGARVRVADLATPVGFQAEEGGLLRAVDANGTLVLRAASYSLFFFPTGGPLPWLPDAEDPWSTLPPRVLVATARPPDSLRVRRLKHRSHDTDIALREGPAEPGPEPLIQPHERLEGHLVITKRTSEERLAIGERALERGIILGRYSRCAGNTTEISRRVSRVHAVLLRHDGQVHLIDAGSTYGTYKGHERMKCEPVAPGCSYRLARMRVRWEPGPSAVALLAIT